MEKVVIIAPHQDDEIIGCFEVLNKRAGNNLFTTVLYPNSHNLDWSEDAKKYNPLQIVPIFAEEGQVHIDRLCEDKKAKKETLIFSPDPTHETHPEHRRIASVGEYLLRQKQMDVIFYSVNMQAPYIREINQPDLKQEALEFYYPDKSDLWKYEHKYFLFEGYCDWFIGWDDE